MASQVDRRRHALWPCLLLSALSHVPAATADDELQPNHLTGNVTTVVTRTDNMYYQESVKQSATGLLLTPALRYLTQTGTTTLDLKGDATYGVFTAPGAKDDYFDRQATARLGWTPTVRNRFSLDGGYQHGHDPFGLVRTEGSPTFYTDLDEWNRKSAGGHYRYGAPSATVNAEVGMSVARVNYTTNRAGTQFLDYKSNSADYNLYYNYTPKSALVLNFIRTGVGFDHPYSGVDDRGGHVYQLRTGVKWLATAKTSGDVRIGYRQRTFDNLPDSVEGVDWAATLNWSPTVPWLLMLTTARSEDQSYRSDTDVIDVKATSLTVKHVVNSRARFTLQLDDLRSKFFGADRYDENRNGAIGLEYAALSNVFLVANVGYQTRESTAPGLDFHRLGSFVGVRFGRPG